MQLCVRGMSLCSKGSLPVAWYSVLEMTCSYFRVPHVPESVSCPVETLSIVKLAVFFFFFKKMCLSGVTSCQGCPGHYTSWMRCQGTHLVFLPLAGNVDKTLK